MDSMKQSVLEMSNKSMPLPFWVFNEGAFANQTFLHISNIEYFSWL